MSTKTFFPKKDPLAVFLALSALLHAALFWALISFNGLAEKVLDLVPAKKEPVFVDVIELPPAPFSKAKPSKEPKLYSDQDRSFQKETAPRKGSQYIIKVPVQEKSAKKGANQAQQKPAQQGPAKNEKTFSLPREEPLSKGLQEKPDIKQQGKEISREEKTQSKSDAQKPPEARELPTSPPKLFLSDARIAELAKEYETTAPKGEQGKTLQLNTSELRYQKYLLSVKRKIELVWEYPALATRNGWQGKLHIDFSINKDGTIREARIIRSSNYPALDDAAITAIRLAGPFPPFPDDFDIEQLNIKGQFEYIITAPRGPQ